MDKLTSAVSFTNTIYSKINDMPYGAHEMIFHNHSVKFIKYPVTVAGSRGHGECIPELKTFGIMSIDGTIMAEVPSYYGTISIPNTVNQWGKFMSVLGLNLI